MFNYPETPKVDNWDEYHGRSLYNPYSWLEDDSSEEVLEWARNQDKFSRKFIDKIHVKEELKERINDLLDFDFRAAPFECHESSRVFFPEKKAGQDKYMVYMQENLGSEKTLVINPNEWKNDESLSFFSPSPKGKYLAYGKDSNGSENPGIYILDVDTGRIVDGPLLGRRQCCISWLNEESFYYSKHPPKKYLPKGEENYWVSVYFHELGKDSSEDERVFYHDSIKEYKHFARVTSDRRHVLFYRSSFSERDVYFKRVGSKEVVPIFEKGFRTAAKIIEDKIFIFTNWNAPKGRILVTDVTNPEKENWKEIVPESEDSIKGFSFIAGKLYIKYLHSSFTKISVFSLEGEYLRDLDLPGFGVASLMGNYDGKNVWLTFSSFNFPPRIYKYHFGEDRLELFFKPDLDLDPYEMDVRQVYYKSKDGTSVSMFVLKKKETETRKCVPALLTGYGGFNKSMVPDFSMVFCAWVERGGVVAIPNLRGGGEYGREWHDAGRLEKKQNVFDDFISAAEYLITNKYTSSDMLSISGGSNGGLLVGATMVQRPDLFKAVHCQVPLLDMLKYHKFGFANIWAEEYGSSEDKNQFNYLVKYSPYHNIKEDVDYPAALFTASKNDSRVHPMHAFKMVARLQELNRRDRPALLLFREHEGHIGGSKISQYVETISEEFAFLMEMVGLSKDN